MILVSKAKNGIPRLKHDLSHFYGKKTSNILLNLEYIINDDAKKK
jgi:hypothetical protein